MNEAPANPVGLDAPKCSPPWTRARWLKLIALVFALHIALIFLFGERQPIVPRAVTHAPMLKLANDAGELLALNDPTLFALPHQRDFASAVWLQTPAVPPPHFGWTEDPRFLTLPADGLGVIFGQFMQTNTFASYPLDFKPAPELRVPVLLIEPLLAQTSTLQIEGGLAQRQIPGQINLPAWPFPDVLAPSLVQVLVDTAGNVISTVLLTPSGYDIADQRALELARTLRFKPASHLAVGRIIFNWHTLPVVTPAVPATASP
jgi:TonB family protein